MGLGVPLGCPTLGFCSDGNMDVGKGGQAGPYQGWAAAGSRGWESKNQGLGEQRRLLLVSSPLPVLFCTVLHKILGLCVQNTKATLSSEK